MLAQLRRSFKPEFLNRIDETVLFTPLGKKQIAEIIDVQLKGLRKRLAGRKITLELTDACKEYIAESAYDPAFGARPLKRFIQHMLENPLARGIIEGSISDDSTVVVDAPEHPDTDAPLRITVR